jgi:hypothetical protein
LQGLEQQLADKQAELAASEMQGKSLQQQLDQAVELYNAVQGGCPKSHSRPGEMKRCANTSRVLVCCYKHGKNADGLECPKHVRHTICIPSIYLSGKPMLLKCWNMAAFPLPLNHLLQ